ncbi:MAG: AraC family transcriptional regulator [Coprobacter sp.]|nr:AraC family transcriptional regulator [Coprobacter sp.]
MIKIKEGFQGERILSLPEDILHKYRQDTLIKQLFVRKIGFFPKVKHHYVQKSNGVKYCMLIYCVAGKGWYSINGSDFKHIDTNQYIILPARTPYTFYADKSTPWSIYWLHFEGLLSDNFLPSVARPRDIQPGDTSRIQDRLELFEEIYANFAMAYTREYMVQASMYLYPFLSSFLHLEQFRHYKLSSSQEQTLSMKAIHYMSENICNKISLEQLADNFKYSVSHFSALFQKETGYSPISYYIQLKVRKACQYLELSNLKIIEIAEKVGFEEAGYFSRVFTNIMGISPSEYRKRERNNSATL